ncbi:MAG: type IV pilus twitching motility protein PilT [Bdellovibrionales bacterium]
MVNIDDVLTKAVALGASDIHLKAGLAPIIRKNGQLMPLESVTDICDPTDLKDIFFLMTTAQQRAHFEKFRELDLSYGVTGLGRFRVSVLQQRGSIRIVIRHLSHNIPALEELHLPPVLKKIAEYERGLVLVAGVTGSGKSTTLASMVDYINRNHSKHIITLEDPIEYALKDRKSLITQRELGSDTNSFSSALRAALRQDPDVILIGEMRDLETINIALLAAETGHLVLSTLHTTDATETINRILAAYPPLQQTQIRLQLATSLKAVVCQRLAQRADGEGRVPAVEIMVNTPRTAEMISEPSKTKNLINAIEEGFEPYGMQSYDQSLMKLVTEKIISQSEATKLSTHPENFTLRMKGITSMDGKKWNKFDVGGRANTAETIESAKIELDLEIEKNDKSEKIDGQKASYFSKLKKIKSS